MATRNTETGKAKKTAAGKATPRKKASRTKATDAGTEELTEDERESLDNAASNANLM